MGSIIPMGPCKGSRMDAQALCGLHYRKGTSTELEGFTALIGNRKRPALFLGGGRTSSLMIVAESTAGLTEGQPGSCILGPPSKHM